MGFMAAERDAKRAIDQAAAVIRCLAPSDRN
jgi:hypothetical protein